MRQENTYVLNAICDLVKWCIDNPNFDKGDIGSVENILLAVFKKINNNEYYYCANTIKAEENDWEFFVNFYGETDEKEGRKWKPYKYGCPLDNLFYKQVVKCLFIDLQIKNEKINGIETWYSCKLLDFFYNSFENIKYKKLDKKQILEACENLQKKSDESSDDVIQDLEKELKTMFILGFYVYTSNHYFAITYNNGVWYYKDTNNIKECGKITAKDVLEITKKYFKKKEDAYKCNFWAIKKIKKKG